MNFSFMPAFIFPPMYLLENLIWLIYYFSFAFRIGILHYNPMVLHL